MRSAVRWGLLFFVTALLISAILFVGVVPAISADLTNDELQKICAQKTIVYNQQGNKVGEKLRAGFCSGYLQAAFHALRNSAKMICGSNLREEQNAEYLFSVYETYIRDKKVSPSGSASNTLLESYQQAFDCEVTVNNAQTSSSGEMFNVAAKLSENCAKLGNIGSIMHKSLLISSDGRDKVFLTLATNQIKVALLAASLSGEIIGTSQYVKQDEKKSLYPHLKDNLREIVLTALIENKEFFIEALKEMPDSKHSQLCRDANNLIDNSITLIKASIDRLD